MDDLAVLLEAEFHIRCAEFDMWIEELRQQLS